MNAEQPAGTNPYVGPSTFKTHQAHLFFGREREARDLLARVISERLLLFYAQSGAGKSSLLYTRLIPQLTEKGFIVLPVGRVGGDLPAGVTGVDNIFAFNLMSSIDEGKDPQRLAHIPLCDFLARLTRKPVTDAAGKEHRGWVYDATVTPAPRPAGPSARRFILIIDQFEEIVTAHPASWQEREAFFCQLDEAMLAFPNLWVTLTLREDYVAALDPYAPLMADRLRGRFYMERMGPEAALQAIGAPAALAGRPFAPGVAEKLVDDLRKVTVPGQAQTVPGQYVEPMQLQVVCYQLWEEVEKQGRRLPELTAKPEITLEDLEHGGDVNTALLQFYDETIKAALSSPEARGASENELRSWFEKQLITEAGTRGFVHRGKERTGGLPNAVLWVLQNRFLVRVEERSGGAWVELVHDRFVEPIRAGNRAWFAARHSESQSVLQRQAASWDREGRPSGMLLEGEALLEAERWAKGQHSPLEPHEQAFLDACRESSVRRIEHERLRNRRMKVLTMIATAVALLALVGFALAAIQSRIALASSNRAVLEGQQALAARSTAVSEAAIRATAEGNAVSQAAAAATSASFAMSEAAAAATALARAEAQATAASINKNAAEAALGVIATQQAARELPTATPAAEGTPAASPQPAGPGTATVAVAAARTVEAVQTSLAQSAVIQQGLADATATPLPLKAIIEDFAYPLYAEPNTKSKQTASIAATQGKPVEAPVLDMQATKTMLWIKVQTDIGEEGWMDGRMVTYQGDASLLPDWMKLAVTNPVRPFARGVVSNDAKLFEQPKTDSRVYTAIPAGTPVTILTGVNRGTWRLILFTLRSPGRTAERWKGYVPAEAVKVAPNTTN